MEPRQSSEWTKARKAASDQRVREDSSFSELDGALHGETPLDTRRMLEGLLEEKATRASRRKWTGRGLMVFGVVTMLGSCPLSVFSLMGQQSIPVAANLISLALIAGGFALTALRTRLKDTNEALLVAMKYGYRLTAARLALEMDISFAKAEKIIQELVRSGIAEIDLNHKDPDNTITYRIKGL
jgi:hypothetical protein